MRKVGVCVCETASWSMSHYGIGTVSKWYISILIFFAAGPIPLRVREAQVPIVNDNECVRKINAVTEKIFILPASSFCAGGEEAHDACQVRNLKILPSPELLLTCDDHWTLTGPAHPSGGPCGAWLRQFHVTNAGLVSDTFNQYCLRK